MPPCKDDPDVAVVSFSALNDAVEFLKDLVNKADPGSNTDHFGVITLKSKEKLEFNFAS